MKSIQRELLICVDHNDLSLVYNYLSLQQKLKQVGFVSIWLGLPQV